MLEALPLGQAKLDLELIPMGQLSPLALLCLTRRRLRNDFIAFQPRNLTLALPIGVLVVYYSD
jgi:hypothetical protein